MPAPNSIITSAATAEEARQKAATRFPGYTWEAKQLSGPPEDPAVVAMRNYIVKRID